MMTEQFEFKVLLAENELVLERLAARHDLGGIREIEIVSKYSDKGKASAARKYIKQKYDVPRDMLFQVVTRKYSEDDVTIELTFSLDAVPEAELITKYELMLRDAAERFGGETPGWEIAQKAE